MNMISTRTCWIAVISIHLLASCADAAERDEEYLKTLPDAEQALADTVDHWGLPFADQLHRFTSARSSFRRKLKDRAPTKFIVGIQHGLEKIPKKKYWFKGTYGTSVSMIGQPMQLPIGSR